MCLDVHSKKQPYPRGSDFDGHSLRPNKQEFDVLAEFDRLVSYDESKAQPLSRYTSRYELAVRRVYVTGLPMRTLGF